MTNKSNFEVLDSLQQLQLEQSWLEATRTNLRVRPIDDYLQLVFAENANPDDSIAVIRQFTLLVEKGITPPAAILSAIAARFKVYLDKKPYDSLDSAFNLKPKQSVGHPIAHRLSREERGRLVYEMWCLRQKAKLDNKILSIEKSASELINRMSLDLTEDALKKDYIDMKADNIFDNALQELGSVFGEIKS